jgi:hypothetical protein
MIDDQRRTDEWRVWKGGLVSLKGEEREEMPTRTGTRMGKGRRYNQKNFNTKSRMHSRDLLN